MNLIEKIKRLREETEISISECKRVLEEAKGDLEKAKEILKKRYGELAKKKKEKEVKEGVIEAYIHPGKKIGVLLELRCESDFVANNPEFQKLAHELCLQIAAIDPEEIPLLEQNWIRDESKKIKDLISEYIAKFDENIVIEKFARFQIK
jgi:elongation factor Ts